MDALKILVVLTGIVFISGCLEDDVIRVSGNITNYNNYSAYNVSANGTNVTDYINLINGTNITFVLSSHNLTIDSVGGASAASDNTKVNKSGDNITGKINFTKTNGSCLGWTIFGSSCDSPIMVYENDTIRSELSLSGVQAWRIRAFDSAKTEAGYIIYSNPGGMPGFALFNASLGSRINIYMNTDGLKLEASNTGSSYNAGGIQIGNQSNSGALTVLSLAGSGNAYPVRSDANGKLEVNRTAGAGITMKSPDGNSWCLTVTNGGTTLVTSGACS